jgi:hypothetical protein
VSLVATSDPQTLEEMTARRKAALARMQSRAGGRDAERAIPAFVRAARGQEMSPQAVFDAVAASLPGGLVDPDFRAAAAYWLLGLTAMTPLQVADALRLEWDRDAVDAMRTHARLTGLPPLDVRGRTA